MQASSEGKMRGIGRMCPAEKAKERVMEDRASMEVKEELGAKEYSRSGI